MDDHQEHLADWQREAVLAATGEMPEQPVAPAPLDSMQPSATAQTPTGPQVTSAPAQAIPTAASAVQMGSFEVPVAPIRPIPSTSQSTGQPKTHTVRKLVIIFGALIAILLVASLLVSSLKPKKSAQNNAASQTQAKGRQIPSDCYQFSIPYTYEFDLSTTQCTLSGGDGIQKELIGVQPIKETKTDDTEIKNISAFTLQSFAKTYPSLKQVSQTAAQFAGKPALQTVASLDNDLQLTMYVVKPDNPYTIKNESYPLVLITYTASASQTDTLKTLEQSWQWH